jgi:hypothetical protein
MQRVSRVGRFSTGGLSCPHLIQTGLIQASFIVLGIWFCATWFCITDARANFVNGVETFNGTVKDTTTWEAYDPLGILTQNGKITINAIQHPEYFEDADLTTRLLRIGVGGFVQADVTVHSKVVTPDASQSPADSAYLILTNNSAGTGDFTLFDTYYLSNSENFFSFNSTSFFTGGYHSNGGGQGIGYGGTPTFDVTYQLRIDRLSATSVKFTQNGSSVTQTVPSNSAPLFVSLAASEVVADFDNIVVGGNVVPEPAMGLSCVAITIGVARRRRPVRAVGSMSAGVVAWELIPPTS